MGSYTNNRELSIYVAIGWLPISDKYYKIITTLAAVRC